MTNQKLARLKQLEGEKYPSDEEILEMEQIREELELSASDNYVPNEKTASLKKTLEDFVEQRKRLELEVKIRQEQFRIEELKRKLKNQVWCEECKIWVDEDQQH